MSFLQLRASHTPLLLLAEPTVTTQAATSVSSSSATGNGTLVNLGGSAVTEKGFVYSTNPQPTTADTKVIVAGGATGAYTGSLSGLSGGTLYHYRAYATNAIGTGYGDDVQFTTTTSVATVDAAFTLKRAPASYTPGPGMYSIRNLIKGLQYIFYGKFIKI